MLIRKEFIQAYIFRQVNCLSKRDKKARMDVNCKREARKRGAAKEKNRRPNLAHSGKQISVIETLVSGKILK